MAKKKKIKTISKTEKKLRNKRKYQQSKRNKERKKLNLAVESLNKLKGKKVGKNIIYNIPENIKNELGIKNKNYKASKQTIINAYYQKIYKINNVVNEIEDKLINRFKFKQKGAKSEKIEKGNIIIPLGFVWNVDESLKKYIFDNDKVQTVNGINKKKNAPELINKVNEEKSSMSSQNLMSLQGKKGDYTIIVENLEDKNKKEQLKITKKYATVKNNRKPKRK